MQGLSQAQVTLWEFVATPSYFSSYTHGVPISLQTLGPIVTYSMVIPLDPRL